MPVSRPDTPGEPSLCFVTLSHHSDLERCELLVRTIDRHVSPRIPHYIVVDRADRARFRHLHGAGREVLCAEDVLPARVFRLPFAPSFWFSLETLPFRGWILQQLVKLALPPQLDQEIAIHVDTDVAFIRPFDPRGLVRDGRVRLYRVPDAHRDIHRDWHRAAGRLLGLPARDYHGASYVGEIIPWLRRNVIGLHERIEQATGRPWFRAAAARWHMSEYLLYGVFVEHILGEEAAGHYFDPESICFGYWDRRPMPAEEARHWLGKIGPQHVAVMVASYSRTPLESYRGLLGGE